MILIGVDHGGDAVTQRAKGALLSAYNSAASYTPNLVFAPAANLAGLTLASGVYRDPTSFAIAGTLTLNAAGNPNAIWIFQTGSTLTTASFSKVVLTGGAQACHVFWQVGSSATLGTSSLFKGTILAFSSITLTTGASVEGRLLALNGAVTLDTNTITVTQCANESLGGTGDVATVLGTVLETGALLPALTPNQTEVAGALAKSVTDARQSRVVDFLSNTPLSSLPRELDKIAPEELTSIYNLGFAQFDTEVFSVQQRLQEVRANASGDQPAAPPERVPDGKSLAGLDRTDAKTMVRDKENARGSLPGTDRWGFFVEETGEFASLGDTSNANGYHSRSEGTTLGFDRRLCNHVVMGLTVSYAHTDSDLIDGGKLQGDGGKAALYALYHQGGFYTEGLIGGGWNSYDTRRGALGGSAFGTTDSTQFDAYCGLGYDVKLGRVTLTPMGSLLYTQVGIDGFNERGSLEPLHIDSQTESSLRTRAGLRAACTSRVGAASVTPSVSAQWQHDYLDAALPLDARLQNGSSSRFTVYGPRVGRDSALLTAAVNVAWDRYALYLAYQADVGVANYESQTVLGGARVSW